MSPLIIPSAGNGAGLLRSGPSFRANAFSQQASGSDTTLSWINPQPSPANGPIQLNADPTLIDINESGLYHVWVSLVADATAVEGRIPIYSVFAELYSLGPMPTMAFALGDNPATAPLLAGAQFGPVMQFESAQTAVLIAGLDQLQGDIYILANTTGATTPHVFPSADIVVKQLARL